MQLFSYTSPLVSIKESKAWIINGNFNLIHVIDLSQFERQLEEVSKSIKKNFRDLDRKLLVNFHLNQIADRINLLRAKPSRKQRSIEWIGSALKWVAGNPDAADWNKILQSQQEIVENNNEQYKVNEKISSVIEDMTRKINWVIENSNREVMVADIQKFEQDIIHQVLLIKEEVNEIVRACQMAKSGIVNTNLLNHDEVTMLINEFETLPYENEIEAIEFGVPSIYANSSMLLYILSIPKVRKNDYNMLLIRPTIINDKQVNIDFNKVLVNQDETYGIVKNCLSISNSTVCREEALQKVPEDHCLSRLLKGGRAACTYRTNTNEVIELIQEDTIYLTNFNGELRSNNSIQTLSGTLIVRLNNETIQIKNRTFTSSSSTVLQALPPIMTNITNEGHKIDVQFVHSLSLRNIERLSNLTNKVRISTVSDAVILLLFISFACVIWRKISGRLNLPAIKIPQERSNQN